VEEHQQKKFVERLNKLLASMPAPETDALTSNPAGRQEDVRNALYILGQDDPQFIKVAAEAGHFYLPAIVGNNFVGAVDPVTGKEFTLNDLVEILLYSQFPDETRVFDAKTNGFRSFLEPDSIHGGDNNETLAGVLTEKSIHSLTGGNVRKSVEFYLGIIRDNRDNNAVVGVAMHGLVDSLYHSTISTSLPDFNTLMDSETHKAPLGHGLLLSKPDYMSLEMGKNELRVLLEAFSTITGVDGERTKLEGQARTIAGNAVDDAYDIFHWIQYNKRGVPMEQAFINSARAKLPKAIADIAPELNDFEHSGMFTDTPSCSGEHPITPESTLEETTNYLPEGYNPKQFLEKGIDAVVRITDRYITTYNTGDQRLRPSRYGAVTLEEVDRRWREIQQRQRGPRPK
jgi:hypothetical protein